MFAARRSKEDILSEIRRLQSQMAELEDRVNSSAKVMNGGGAPQTILLSSTGPSNPNGPIERVTAASANSNDVVISAAAVASSESSEKQNKDK